MPLAEYIASLGSNPYFGAGFGLFGVGAGVAILRKGVQGAAMYFRRHHLITLEVPSRDKSYQWLLQWITEKGARKTQHLSVETTFEKFDTGHVKTQYHFIPSLGKHFFRCKNTWIQVERTREQTLDLQLGQPFETVTLTALGNNRQIFFEILEEAREMALTQTEGKTIMYEAMGSEWRPSGHPRNRRPISSVILDEGVSDDILDDIRRFINKRSWYSDRGIPYRRGYLLHGPPGSGKSSFIAALAGELSYGICILNLSNRGLSDDRLNHLLSSAPENTIILLEDVDAALVSREETQQEKHAYEGLNRLTWSGVLNCLDGVASAEGRILFMTTNHPDRLDPALIRPGRVDFKKYIGYCSRYQIVKMYEKFYQDSGEEAKIFADKVIEQNIPVSPAELQGFFMMHQEDKLETLVKNIPHIWEETLNKKN